MVTASIEPCLKAWRHRARRLLDQCVRPGEVLWEETGSEHGSLFGTLTPAAESGTPSPTPVSSRPLVIPRAFLDLAELVACHRAGDRWGMLYRVAWRITLGNEKHLLQLATDGDVKTLHDWASGVRRDRHKMKAFVRFRKVGETAASDGQQREQFVAWFEPEHAIVELTAPFFAKRFAGMDWSILTPDRCAHWDGSNLQFTEGVSKESAPADDALEDYWRTYYSSIFNPARLKLKAMQSEMPKKYWRNLPEAPLIAELTSEASLRAGRMLEAPSSDRAHVSTRIPSGVPTPQTSQPIVDPVDALRTADEADLNQIRELASHCRACPLYDRSTQTVFGRGPENAQIMIIGEQPGDKEDLAGKPFIGPSGDLLHEALEKAGIGQDKIYVTNVVKHFKWKRNGKRRIHQSPSSSEIHACKPWVLAEILKVRPHTIICLGATAAKALIREDFPLLSERGITTDCTLAERVIATVHPSYLLRLKNDEDREQEMTAWIADLRLAVIDS